MFRFSGTSRPDFRFERSIRGPVTATFSGRSSTPAAHVAEFNEPGVKEQVLLAWKTEKARPLAMNRAAELAKKVQAAGDKSMAEALGETTVTGDKEGLQLVVHNSPEFTWLRERSAPGPRGDATTPEVSVLPFVEKAGRKFMETVFDGLDVGGTGVAPNADDSVYYVVKVLERPFDAGTAREQLMTTPLFGRSTGIGGSPYDQLAQNESSRRGSSTPARSRRSMR